MATLITGGGSQIGIELARLLKESGREVVFASRSGDRIPEGYASVKFDWYDPSTFANAFSTLDGNGIPPEFDSVYITPPPAELHPSAIVLPFIDLAIERGVKKFVNLTATLADPGRATKWSDIARVSAYLKEKGVEYATLRPTWFSDNIKSVWIHDILANGSITSCVPTGRIPFVAVSDIALAGFNAIERQGSTGDVIVVGPETLTYTEVASIVSDTIGRPVTHNVISEAELAAIYSSFGPQDYAEALAEATADSEKGSEEKWVGLTKAEQEELNVTVFVGKTSVREVAEKNKSVFDVTQE